jgi:iodotyrosine deiodinase
MAEKIINGYPFVEYQQHRYTEVDMIERSQSFFNWLNTRRTVRDFSAQPVPQAVIETIIKTASTAPSGAHKQPWSFCLIQDKALKKQIREAAEKEEYESYSGRMSADWLDDLRPLQTDWQKPFLETAPYLIVVFKKVYENGPGGSKKNNYYVQESVGLACGFMLAAIHNAGLVALTHTPSPMNFLSKILNRPDNERPFLLIPVGYPAEETFVPKLTRKPLNDVLTIY